MENSINGIMWWTTRPSGNIFFRNTSLRTGSCKNMQAPTDIKLKYLLDSFKKNLCQAKSGPWEEVYIEILMNGYLNVLRPWDFKYFASIPF